MSLAFWKRTHRPKTYRPRQTAKQKSEELIAKAWLRYLKDHPMFAQEVARERYGMPESPNYFEKGEAPLDLLDVLRQAKEAKDLIKEETKDEKGGGALDKLLNSEVGKAIAEGLVKMVMPQLQQQMQQQATQPRITEHRPDQLIEPAPEPEQIAEEEPKSQQDALREFGNRFLELEPEAAAAELYEYKDKTGDVRQPIWSYLSENSVDEVIELIPEVITQPEYAFLAPFAEKLSTNKGRRWLALVIDAVNKLKDVESTGEV